MKIDRDNLLESILEGIRQIHAVDTEDIPNISLYMDQVTTFMDQQFADTKRHEDDKILTKTMINNYAKNKLLPPPEKKKYSKEHLLMMIFIYYFKNVLTINDISTILDPLTENYFEGDGEITMESIYEEIRSLEFSRLPSFIRDVEDSYDLALHSFEDVPEEDKIYLQNFAFICNLIFDVYIKKMIIESFIDTLPDPKNKNKKKK